MFCKGKNQISERQFLAKIRLFNSINIFMPKFWWQNLMWQPVGKTTGQEEWCWIADSVCKMLLHDLANKSRILKGSHAILF